MALHVTYVTSATNTLPVTLILTGMSGCTQAKSLSAALSVTNSFLIRQVSADIELFTALTNHTNALSVEIATNENQV